MLHFKRRIGDISIIILLALILTATAATIPSRRSTILPSRPDNLHVSSSEQFPQIHHSTPLLKIALIRRSKDLPTHTVEDVNKYLEVKRLAIVRLINARVLSKEEGVSLYDTLAAAHFQLTNLVRTPMKPVEGPSMGHLSGHFGIIDDHLSTTAILDGPRMMPGIPPGTAEKRRDTAIENATAMRKKNGAWLKEVVKKAQGTKNKTLVQLAEGLKAELHYG